MDTVAVGLKGGPKKTLSNVECQGAHSTTEREGIGNLIPTISQFSLIDHLILAPAFLMPLRNPYFSLFIYFLLVFLRWPI